MIHPAMETISVWDEERAEVVEVSAEDFEKKLGDILKVIKRLAARLTKIGGYDLKSFDVTLALKGSVFVISAEGTVALHYKTA